MRHGWTVFPTLIFLGLGLCGFSWPARAGEPLDDLLGRRTVPIVLLLRSDVQLDLNLKPKQVMECERAAVSLYDRASGLKGRRDSGANAARLQIDLEMDRWLSENLTPEQFGRLEQIDLQWEGAGALLSRPFLDDSLQLTDQQKNKIKECISESNAQRAARRAWTYDDHVNQTRQAISVLDERQRTLWIRSLGPHCAFKIAAGPGTAENQAAARRGGPDPAPPPR